jgi:general secretion pathway protein I
MRAIPLSRTGDGEDGFTLVEVLVALAILGISFAALFSAFSASLDRTRQTSDASRALLEAQSLMDRLGADFPLEAGTFRGTTEDQQMGWTIKTVTFGTTEDRSAWPVAAYSVTVTVHWGDEPSDAIRLQGLKLSGGTPR